MPDEMDDELLLSLSKMDLHNNNVNGGDELQSNPFYKPYNKTDTSLFKKFHQDNKMKVRPSKKYIQDKPYLRSANMHSQEKATNWLLFCKNEMHEHISWVKPSKIKIKVKAYNMKDISDECNDIAYSIDPVNEFPLKQMSEMAEAMYM